MGGSLLFITRPCNTWVEGPQEGLRCSLWLFFFFLLLQHYNPCANL